MLLLESMQRDLCDFKERCRADVHLTNKMTSVMEFLSQLSDVKEQEGQQQKISNGSSAECDNVLGLLEISETNEVAAQILDKAVQLFQASHGFFFFWEKRREFILKQGFGFFRQFTGRSVRVNEGFIGEIWHTGQPFFVEDYSVWEKRIFTVDFKTIIGVPLLIDGKIQGVLGLAFDEVRIEMANYGLLWLARFAEVASIAFANTLVCSKDLDMAGDIAAWAVVQEEIRQVAAALEQSSGVTIITDLDSCVTYASSHFKQLTKAVNGETYCEELYQAILETVSQGEKWHGEVYNWKKDGQRHWALISISPISTEQGHRAYALEVEQDITEQHVFEEILQTEPFEFTNILEKIRIQQQEFLNLKHIKKHSRFYWGLDDFSMLQQYLERIVAIIHIFQALHEFSLREKMILLQTKADAITELIKKQKLDYGLVDLDMTLAETDQRLNHVVNIVRALKLFARAEQEETLSEYQINEGVKAALSVVAHEIQAVADLVVELGSVPSLYARERQINQAIFHLLTNAAQAIACQKSEKKGSIRIRTYEESGWVCCSIHDSGIGIDETVLKEIFNPFYTTKLTKTEIGLGLSISRDIIVNKHQGRLLVTSEPGSGSSFVIQLPYTLE